MFLKLKAPLSSHTQEMLGVPEVSVTLTKLIILNEKHNFDQHYFIVFVCVVSHP